jgi:predicted  nucleic acid-binding Zn-ribbon protein
MFEMIEKLLILQDRDRQIQRVKTELNHIEPERQMLKSKTSGAQNALDASKTRVKELESRRKDLDLEVQTKKQQIRDTPTSSSRPERTRNIARWLMKSKPASQPSSKSKTRKSN